MEAKFDCKMVLIARPILLHGIRKPIIYDQQNQLFPLLSALTMD